MPGHAAKSFDFRLHQFALVVVAIGVVVSLIAAISVWIAQGVVAATMLKGTAFAVVAAYPVWQAYRTRVRVEAPGSAEAPSSQER